MAGGRLDAAVEPTGRLCSWCPAGRRRGWSRRRWGARTVRPLCRAVRAVRASRLSLMGPGRRLCLRRIARRLGLWRPSVCLGPARAPCRVFRARVPCRVFRARSPRRAFLARAPCRLRLERSPHRPGLARSPGRRGSVGPLGRLGLWKRLRDRCSGGRLCPLPPRGRSRLLRSGDGCACWVRWSGSAGWGAGMDGIWRFQVEGCGLS